MKWGDIRSRMLQAALLPAILVAVVLSGVFMTVRLIDHEQLHDQQSRALVRQVAVGSEYGLYAGDMAQLEKIARQALREADVLSVAILNTQGERLVFAGQESSRARPALTPSVSEIFDPATDTDTVQQPIVLGSVSLDDLYEPLAGSGSAVPLTLGHVLIEFSHVGAKRRGREMLLVSLSVMLGGLIFACLLAMRLGRGVIRPILRVSDMIERIGSGEFSARGVLSDSDPLFKLQRGLNLMAERLQTGRDHMEQRITEATLELRQKKEEAETATLAKSRFLAAASHDLRQPTHALGMFVARLAQLPHDAQAGEVIGHLEASVHAMQDLLNGLLDLSRLEANAVQAQVRPVALDDLFSQLRHGLSVTASDKGLRLRVRPTSSWVATDPALLYQMLLNLVGNALRYTERGGVLVACRLRGNGRVARIEIWDTGIGIDPAHHALIFNEFYQVANSERDRRKGLGLGLNIVRRTAALLGHALTLRSSLGHGTRFSIDVALAVAGAPTRGGLSVKANRMDELVGRQILVIEDDALAREGLVTLLQSWGAEVRATEDIATALAHVNEGLCPDLIVSDYRLRDGENGMQAIEQLRAAAGCPVRACLISGDTDPALMEAARGAGLTLLHKPVRPAKLRSLLRSLASDQADAEGAEVA